MAAARKSVQSLFSSKWATSPAMQHKVLQDALKYKSSAPSKFKSTIFPVENIEIAGREESILRGGRNLFKYLPKAFEDVKRVAIVGWGSQGPAQAQNLRESLEGTGVQVVVGLREGSASIPAAERKGFSKHSGTLLSIPEAVSSADLTILLISDAACSAEYSTIFNYLRPNSYLGLSHGFLLGYLKSIGKSFPSNVNVIAVCPKGMGPSVRQLYVQGKEVNGAGINSSIAVHQDVSSRAIEVALGWSVALGSPVTFMTSLEAEYKSDLVGERAILLGGIHGAVEALYQHFVSKGRFTAENAYLNTVDSVTGPISKAISERGLLGLYRSFPQQDRAAFERAYALTYVPWLEIVHEIYDEVASGREIMSVVDHGNRISTYGIGRVDGSDMWKVGQSVRAKRGTESASPVPLNPTMAGVYVAGIVSQCDLLKSAGHNYSEIINESIIEGIDSLNPYMWSKGVSYMVDNCSTTARLGSRKWAPRFEYALRQQVIPKLDVPLKDDEAQEVNLWIDAFIKSDIHEAFDKCADLRPSVSIIANVDNGNQI